MKLLLLSFTFFLYSLLSSADQADVSGDIFLPEVNIAASQCSLG
jgi:hypothetical protein